MLLISPPPDAMLVEQEPGFLRRTVINVTSGTVAGVAVCLVGHPFDTLKVRLQTQPAFKPVYTGLIDCFTKTLKWEGVGGLYKGVASPLIGQMFFRATLFTSYYQVKALQLERLMPRERPGQRLTTGQYFVCGAFTGVVASLAEGPIDLFKTKMQTQIIRAKTGATVQYRHVFHAAYVITSAHGLRGVYQGLGATVLRNFPSFASYFGFYEMFREYSKPEGGTVSDLTVGQQLISGGVAGLLYWFLTYPTDVVKSTMQSDDIVKRNRKYKSILDCVRKLYLEEGGLPRFFRGFTPCLMRTIFSSSAMLLVLEKTRGVLS